MAAPMTNTIPPSRPVAHTGDRTDRIMKRVIIPIVIVVGLVGLIRYTLTGPERPKPVKAFNVPGGR